jgi:hypothetical protein
LYSPVFICGSHRSGTTLLQQLLDGHPDLVVLPSEGTYFTSFRYLARPDPAPADLDRFAAEWIARFVDPNARPHFKLGRASSSGNPGALLCRRLFAWQGALSKQKPALATFSSLLALVAAYRDVTQPAARPSRWVEKTPLNEFHVRHLTRFPNARFIHLVRNPLASMASLRQAYARKHLPPFDASAQAAVLARSLAAADRYRQRLGERYLVVRYEDLAAAPRQEMTRVCQFLNLELTASSLVPSVGGIPAGSNSSFRGSLPGIIHEPGRSDALAAADSLAVRALTTRAAKRHGYDLIPVSPLVRWKIALSAFSRRWPQPGRRRSR